MKTNEQIPPATDDFSFAREEIAAVLAVSNVACEPCTQLIPCICHHRQVMEILLPPARGR